MIIKDGAGTGNTVKVTSENRLDADAIVRPINQHINETYQKNFSLFFEGVTPAGADDYFFYFRNNGDKDVHFTKFRLLSSVVGTVEIHQVAGTASSVTDIAPANRFIGSSAALDATIGTDSDITGLTKEADIVHLRLSSSDVDFIDDESSHIIVPPGQAIALLWDNSTGTLKGTINVYEDQGV